MALGTYGTLLGLVNAMVGAVMLVVPVSALKAGYMNWTIALFVIGSVCCYTAYLMVSHLGQAKDIRGLILNHFKGDNNYVRAYLVIAYISFLSSMFTYFPIFCQQIQGLLGYNQRLPEMAALFLLVWVLAMRQFDLNDIGLAFGIASVVGYMFFLTWALSEAPQGPKRIQPFGEGTTDIILTFFTGFTSLDFLLQIIVHNPNKKDYKKIVFLLYLIGGCAYLYTAFGAYALVNIQSDGQTIVQVMQDFNGDAWQLAVLQILYTIHILTVFPQYLIFSKVRLFQIFGIESQQNAPINISDVLYFIVMIGVCFLLKKNQVPLNLIVDLTGAVLGYLLTTFIPCWVHLKCVHCDKSSGMIEGPHERNLMIQYNQSRCKMKYSSTKTLYLQLLLLIFWGIVSYLVIFRALIIELTEQE